MFLARLMELYFLDDPDCAWTSIDEFFTFGRDRNTQLDFPSYVVEWDRLFEEAETYGGLQLNDVAKCCLVFARSGLSDRVFADLRLKVNGDLNRYRDIIRLQLKIIPDRVPLPLK